MPWAALPSGSLFDSHLHLDLLSHRLGAGAASLHKLVARDPAVPWSAFGGCVANFVRPSDWQAGLGPGLRAAAMELVRHEALAQDGTGNVEEFLKFGEKLSLLRPGVDCERDLML